MARRYWANRKDDLNQLKDELLGTLKTGELTKGQAFYYLLLLTGMIEFDDHLPYDKVAYNNVFALVRKIVE
jgi:hypothetical protein